MLKHHLVSRGADGQFTYPRDIKLTADCSQLLVALENFPDFSGPRVRDPPGQTSTVLDPGGKYPKAKVMDFTQFDDQ